MSQTIAVNTCTTDVLERLAHVGPKTAQKIIQARPIGDTKALQELLPPSAWMEIEEQGVGFDFGAHVEEPPPSPAPQQPPPEPAFHFVPEQVTLRRVRNGQLKEGAKYLCVWNMKWGPSGEAVAQADAPLQAEIEGGFNTANMSIMFAHYGPSIHVRTRNRGLVPLLLFEIIKTEEIDDVGKGD